MTNPKSRTPACSCLLLTAGRREKCRVVDRRPQHQKRLLFATTRKPASACVREQRNTSEGKTKARKKTPIKTLSSGCLPQALQKAEHTCMPACSQACKHMRQRATQHIRGETNSEEKTPIKTLSSGCLPQAFKTQNTHVCLHARKPASACVREQRNTKEGKQTARKKTPIKMLSSGCLLQALTKPKSRTPACSCLLLTAGRREKCRVVDRRPQHQKRLLFATTRKPASACVREQRNTSEGKTKARKKTPIKTLSSGCLPQALQKAEHTCMPACSQACKRMRQGATQHKRGETNSEEKNTNQNAVKRLLTASFDKTQITHACVLLLAPHSRPP